MARHTSDTSRQARFIRREVNRDSVMQQRQDLTHAKNRYSPTQTPAEQFAEVCAVLDRHAQILKKRETAKGYREFDPREEPGTFDLVEDGEDQ